ncbi:MAG: hypothetical protein F9K28_11070 [Bacteroidetes bacterium]|nr:MAG: hypothetical protein F9K28_11070 [Bacteroidota bacterium]
MTHYFDPPMYPQMVTLVGLGGTGSQLSRLLARMMYDMKRSQRQPPILRFIDPDRIELKNCGRQSFCEAEVGDYKAQVLARRYNFALGLDIAWITEPVSAERHFATSDRHLVIGAVDNYLARRELAAVPGIWLDCGNHFSSGQIVLGNTSDGERVRQAFETQHDVIRALPNAALVFPELLQPEVVPTDMAQSCADLLATGEQHLFVNDWGAAIAAQYIYKLLHRQPIESFLTYFSLNTLTVKSDPITYSQILSYLSPT